MLSERLLRVVEIIGRKRNSLSIGYAHKVILMKKDLLQHAIS